jgi:cytochrome c biogenesis protein CcmG, thiol:disulfide interchange protein DsbE
MGMSAPKVLWVPLILFILLASGLVYGLARPADRTIASAVTGARVPDFRLPPLRREEVGVNSADLATGEPHLVNLFASWCIPCIAEAPYLQRIAAAGVPVIGIAVRDRPAAVANFLSRHGNPYRRIGLDRDSEVQMAFGSSGVPETFIVDGRGTIRRQIIGPVSNRDVDALIAEVRAAR